MNPVVGLILVIVLIAANGFFVAAEFALVAVDRSRVEIEATRGGRRARMASGLLAHLSVHLSGAQLGITVTSLLLGFLTQPSIATLIEPLLGQVVGDAVVVGVSLAVAIALATVVQMIVGELVPKGLAIARPETTTYLLAPAIRIYGLIFGPIIRFLNGAANRTVRLLGVEPTEELSHVRTLTELKAMVQSSSEGGTLADSATTLLKRSIRFEAKSAEDIVVPRTAVIALQRDDSVDDLVRIALSTGHSRFPVYANDIDDVIGTVHVRSVHGVPRELRATTLVGTMMRPVVAVPESRGLGDVLIDLKKAKAHLAVVVDEYGGTAGIITLEDIVEEIVGEIGDEHDPRHRSGTTRKRFGEWTLSGGLQPDEVADVSGCTVPEGEYETLAGFVLDQLGHIPVVGESIEWQGWTFTVLEMDRRRITEVRLTAPPSDVGGDN